MNEIAADPQADSALIIDIRGVFDRGWHKSRGSEELAHLGSAQAAACSALMVLLPIVASAHLDETYRRALFAWDGGFHKTAKPRPPKPEDFVKDLAYFRQLLPTLLGAAHFTAPQHEADDVVATAVVRLSQAGTRCCVVSGDKDLKQLTCRNVTYYCLNRKSILSAQHIMDRYDLRHPAQLAVWLAVCGDHQDGISGVKNWADKKWSDKIMKGFRSQDMSELVEHVVSVIPADQVENFYAAFEATLLQIDVPGVPDPAPLNPAPIEFLEDEGLDPVRRNYARFLSDFRDDPVGNASAADRDY